MIFDGSFQTHEIGNNKLVLHCGAQVVDYEEVRRAATPEPTKTHYPIAHSVYVDHVRDTLRDAGFQISREIHALYGSQEQPGSRYFGLLELEGPHDDYTWALGLRNSHDQSIAAKLSAGTRVFVCDNLSFSGEINLSRKHTRNAVNDLARLTVDAVGQLNSLLVHEDTRVECYKRREITDMEAHDALIRAVDCGAFPPSHLQRILQDWRQPPYEDFQPRNVWSLFNAVTGTYGGRSDNTAVRRGSALRGMFDGLAEVSPFAASLS